MKRSILLASTVLLAWAPAIAADPAPGDEVIVTGSRLVEGAAGASTTVIGEDEIRKSPATTLPDLLSREAGVQMRDLYGDVGGTRATVDMRGFGAGAKNNTLVLVNGRKINDFDLSAIDWGSIPMDSIRRIEITRGSAGSVLYGDGAVGGVINIVTKSPLAQEAGGSLHFGYGSHMTRKVEAEARTGTIGGFAFNAHGSYLNSDGYRDNNDIIDRNLVSELRYGDGNGDWFVKLGGDDQSVGLPGVQRLRSTGCPAATADRTQADTPLDKATQTIVNATAGHSRSLTDSIDLVVDTGIRHKEQEAQFLDLCFGFNNFNTTTMTTWSLTPRLDVAWAPGGLDAASKFGFDLYYTDYESTRRRNRTDRPSHIYNGYQINAALYAANELTLRPGTVLSLGGRVENARFTAGDTFDAGAPGAFGAADQTTDQSDTMWAANLGLEQRIAQGFSLFGRGGRSFRTANIDERIGATGTSLNLQPQTAYEVEAGVRAEAGPAKLQSSVYRMWLRNEIHFVAATFTNVNLDPTERFGWENSAELKVLDSLRLKGTLTYTEAQFAGGRFDGNDVPLVAPWTGSVSAFWDILPDLTFAATVHAADAMRLDNDQANFQPLIGGYYTADLKLMGRIGMIDWSAQVNNLFDRKYYTYGVASAATAGVYNIYPLPERTFYVRAGITF